MSRSGRGRPGHVARRGRPGHVRPSRRYENVRTQVRGVHAHDQQGDQRQVDGRDKGAVERTDVVVGLGLLAALAPAPPAPPGLEAAEDHDQQDDRVREHEREHDQAGKPDEPHRGGHRRHRAAAVERDDGKQVEQIEEEAGEGERAPEVVARRVPDEHARGSAEAAEDRAGEADARLGGGVVTERLGADHRTQEGDEHRRAGLDSLAPQRDHVAHLVDEQQRYEAGAELPAPDRAVGGDGDQHRAGRREQLQLRQQQQDCLELGQEGRDRRQRRSDDALERPLPGLLEVRPLGLVMERSRRRQRAGRRRRGRRGRKPGIGRFHRDLIVAGADLCSGRSYELLWFPPGGYNQSTTHTPRGRQASTWSARGGGCESRSRAAS